tara:strand:- start:2120 stop:2827 length:708 start_codon:yes stop_codon:yes gene_type:complete
MTKEIDRNDKEEYASEMRLYDPDTEERLYMDAKERERFLNASNELKRRDYRLFCQAIHWTGARPAELIELTGNRIDVINNCIKLRTLKQRKFNRKGEVKAPQYREIPVPESLIDSLDYLYDLRNKKRKACPSLGLPLWANDKDPSKHISRTTGWRIVKRAMAIAGIEGKQSSPKGFRHGFGVAMAVAGRNIYEIQKLLGHSEASSSAIYLSVVGREAHDLQMDAWSVANKNWSKD